MTEQIEQKIGTNWGASKRHLLVRPMPKTAFSYEDAYFTQCGRSIAAYDPQDKRIPSQLKGIALDTIPWCKACAKHVPGATAPPSKPVGFAAMSMNEQIAEFMGRAGQLAEIGVDIDAGERLEFLTEEVEELRDSFLAGDMDDVDIDDALIDIAWVSIGWVYKRRGVTVGNAMIAEVDRANMDKVEPIEDIVFYPGTTKVGKKEGWRGPDHEAVLREHGAS